MRCRVVIWSNRQAFIRAMRSLAHREGLEVLGIASTPEAALERMETLIPDVVLVDRETGERHADTVGRLMMAAGRSKVVVVDLLDEAVQVIEGWRATAQTVRELVRTIEGGMARQVA